MTSPTKSKARRRSDEMAVINVSPSLEILEGLDIHNTFASLEARLDSMEIDIARAQGVRDDDSRRIAGDLAVMKARVEDALGAFAQTAGELQDMAKDFERRLALKADPAGEGIRALRTELEARIEGVTAGIGDVLENLARDIGARIDGLAESLRGLQGGMETVAGAVEGLASTPRRLAELEEAVAELRARG